MHDIIIVGGGPAAVEAAIAALPAHPTHSWQELNALFLELLQ